MAITLNTTAPVTTPKTVSTPCDFGWVVRCNIDGSSLDLAKTRVDGVLLPGQSNAATTKVPTFADPSAAIQIVISNLATALANYPSRIGPVMMAIEAGFQGLATVEIPANQATLATATARQAVARGALDTAKGNATAALKTLQDAQQAARSAGVNGATDPAYLAAYAACEAAAPIAASTAKVQVDAQSALDAATAVVVAAQAAVNDLANPPVVLT